MIGRIVSLNSGFGFIELPDKKGVFKRKRYYFSTGEVLTPLEELKIGCMCEFQITDRDKGFLYGIEVKRI